MCYLLSFAQMSELYTFYSYKFLFAHLLSISSYDRRTALTMLTFLGDPLSELTRALDLELTDPGPVGVLGPGRCKRFAMHVVNGEIKACNVSEGPGDPAGDEDPSASLADGIMATMK